LAIAFTQSSIVRFASLKLIDGSPLSAGTNSPSDKSLAPFAKPEKVIYANWLASKPEAFIPTYIFPAVPGFSAVPCQPLITKSVPVQVIALLAEKTSLCTPVPSSMVELSDNLIVPTVSELPAEAPVGETLVLSEPPAKSMFAPLSRLEAPSVKWEVWPMVTVPPDGGSAIAVEYALNTNMLINNGSNLICFGTIVFINVIFYSSVTCRVDVFSDLQCFKIE
jgi:hypothetical protein